MVNSMAAPFKVKRNYHMTQQPISCACSWRKPYFQKVHAPQCSSQHYFPQPRLATFFSHSNNTYTQKTTLQQRVSEQGVKLLGICKNRSLKISKQSKKHVSERSSTLAFKQQKRFYTKRTSAPSSFYLPFPGTHNSKAIVYEHMGDFICLCIFLETSHFLL